MKPLSIEEKYNDILHLATLHLNIIECPECLRKRVKGHQCEFCGDSE